MKKKDNFKKRLKNKISRQNTLTVLNYVNQIGPEAVNLMSTLGVDENIVTASNYLVTAVGIGTNFYTQNYAAGIAGSIGVINSFLSEEKSNPEFEMLQQISGQIESLRSDMHDRFDGFEKLMGRYYEDVVKRQLEIQLQIDITNLIQKNLYQYKNHRMQNPPWKL